MHRISQHGIRKGTFRTLDGTTFLCEALGKENCGYKAFEILVGEKIISNRERTGGGDLAIRLLTRCLYSDAEFVNSKRRIQSNLAEYERLFERLEKGAELYIKPPSQEILSLEERDRLAESQLCKINP
jgi:hypothetical protein